MSSLTGLVNYGDSDDEHDDGGHGTKSAHVAAPSGYAHDASAAIHPPPIPHCPWSACYDEGSGFTYYWNQQTNAVTWEAPPEYLLALKLAQQHMHTAGSGEVSAEEWQLYQQALAEKQNSQNKMAAKAAIIKPTPKTNDNKLNSKDKKHVRDKKNAKAKKRPASDDEDKIELITSYYNSDSDSNDELESPVKPLPPKPQVIPKPVVKKVKKQALPTYGPSLPSNQNYSVPIGPELPPNMTDNKMDVDNSSIEEKKSPKPIENEDSQDESILLSRLKDKAMLLEKLGGEIPSELQKIIRDGSRSGTSSPKPKEKVLDTNIDDLLEEIEKKELPKIKSGSKNSSAINSPRSCDTPPRDEIKPLFPSAKVILEEQEGEKEKPCLFPSAIQENGIDKPKPPSPPLPQEKKNMYLSDTNEITVASRKKLRISNSVLPDRSKSEASQSQPSYTTKYSTHIEGFSSERTGLGFTQDEERVDSPKATISYGNGLVFTKGETLNKEKKDDELEDLMDLVEAKLKHLNELQPCIVTPIQEMLIQMQTLRGAWRAGALAAAYVRRWGRACGAALAQHEARAAPPGWRASFQRSAGRYQYERESDGFQQWEYPAPPADMDICTTPPHPSETEDIIIQPPLPPLPVPAPPPPPRRRTPPPPAWPGPDPPPPGCDDPPPLPPSLPPPPLPPPPPVLSEPQLPKQEIGDELASFYSDLAEIEKQTAPPPPAPPPPSPPADRHTHCKDDKDKDRDKDKDKDKSKKKSKVKISSAVGMKHKSVSSLVAKWQQVADEINSD